MYIRKWRLNRVNPLGYYYTYSKNKKYKATTFFVIIFRHLNIKIFFKKGNVKKIPFVSLSTKGGKWFASCSTHLKPKKCELQMKCITCKKKSIRCFVFVFLFYFFLHILELDAGFLFWNIEVPRTRALCNLPR